MQLISSSPAAQRTSTAGRWAPGSETERSTTAIGCAVRAQRAQEFTGIPRSRPAIRQRACFRMATRSTRASTITRLRLPPVNAFWSVTMYDGKSQLLIENPINRYLINSPMLPSLKKNPDGSLTFYIQKDAPSADKKSNWLPAPNDTVYLVMRLYWPKETPPSILPMGEGTWQPPAVVQAQ